MSNPIVLHEEMVTVKKNQVALRLVIQSEEDFERMKQYVADLKLPSDEDMYFPSDYGVDGDKPTISDLTNDQMRLAYWILSERARWDLIFPKIDRKKDGTFAKGRKITLHRIASSEDGYSEESYGFYGDELRIKTIADNVAVLMIDYTIRKYDESRISIDPMTLS